MTNKEAANWLRNISADIGKAEHRDLWHYEQALYEIIEMLEDAPDTNVGSMIYRQRVLDEIRKCTEVYINNLPPMIDKAEVQTKIMLMPFAQPEPQWIPCSERLPDKGGDYLVTYESGYAEDYGFDLIGIAPFEVDCECFGIWQEKFDRYTLGSLGPEWVDIPVIAWMPLPEPYQAERREDG